MLGAPLPLARRMLGTCRPWLRSLLVGLAFLSALLEGVSASDQGWTTHHEAGRCAIRGQCGKKSFFGGELPCPDNGLAEAPAKDTREKLVKICGEDWSEGDVCCDDDQVRNEPAKGKHVRSAHKNTDRCAEHQPQASGVYHILLSCLQNQLLRPFLHLHLLTQSVFVC